MKKRIVILGSTGSIGKILLNIIKKNKKIFKIILLTANKDHKTLYSQAKKFGVKNLIITDEDSYKILKKKCEKTNINVYNNFNIFNRVFKKKVDDYRDRLDTIMEEFYTNVSNLLENAA